MQIFNIYFALKSLMFTQLCWLFPHFWKFSINIYEPILKIRSFEIRYKLERYYLMFGPIFIHIFFPSKPKQTWKFCGFFIQFDQTPILIVRVLILIQGIWPLLCVLDKSAIFVYIFYNFKLRSRRRAKIYSTSRASVFQEKAS